MKNRFKGKVLWGFGLLLLLVSVLNVGLAARLQPPVRRQLRTMSAHCEALPSTCTKVLDPGFMAQSLAYGIDYILNHQTADGSFDLIYDWAKKKSYPIPNPDFQARVLWYSVLMYQATGDTRMIPLIDKGLRYCLEGKYLQVPKESKWHVPNEAEGTTGASAFFILAIVDYLKNLPPASAYDEPTLRANMNRQIQLLLAAQTATGRFYPDCSDPEKGCKGKPDTATDGKVLLALTKAAKYGGRTDLRPLLQQILLPRYGVTLGALYTEKPAAVKLNKFTPWATELYFEWFTSGWEGSQVFGALSIQLTRWVLEHFCILEWPINSADVLPGIIYAYEIARREGDAAAMAEFDCAIDKLLKKFSAYQIMPLNSHTTVSRFRASDPKAVGGVMAEPIYPGLNTPVTLQQMQALWLARRYCYP